MFVGCIHKIAYLYQGGKSGPFHVIELSSQYEAGSCTILSVHFCDTIFEHEQLKIDKRLRHCQQVNIAFCDRNPMQLPFDTS